MENAADQPPEEAGTDPTSCDAAVQRLRDGDKQALADLFAMFNARFQRLVDVRLHLSLRGRLDVADVLQDAYIDAQERLPNFFARDDGSIFVWLRLVVLQRLQLLERFHLKASKRDAFREVHLTSDSQGPQFGSLSTALAASLTSPSAAAMREECVTMVDRLLAEMDPIDREILILRHFESLPNIEVAEILNIAVTAASNRYVRALRRLKELLQENLSRKSNPPSIMP